MKRSKPTFFSKVLSHRKSPVEDDSRELAQQQKKLHAQIRELEHFIEDAPRLYQEAQEHKRTHLPPAEDLWEDWQRKQNQPVLSRFEKELIAREHRRHVRRTIYLVGAVILLLWLLYHFTVEYWLG